MAIAIHGDGMRASKRGVRFFQLRQAGLHRATFGNLCSANVKITKAKVGLLAMPQRYFLWTAFMMCIVAPVAPSDKPSDSDNEQAVRCLALNLYWEARSEGKAGMVAVAWVVLNRVRDPRFPDTVCAVVQEGGETPPCKFSWWCDGESDRPREAGAWTLAQQIARDMLADPPPDPTQGAVWFHLDAIQTPPWLNSRKRTLHLGSHYFYR
jgi:N-acetylmuramoyl-L-alanine amidase